MEQNIEQPEVAAPTAVLKKGFLRGFIYGIGGLVVLGLVGSVGIAYRMPDRMPRVATFLVAIHAPAVIVDGHVISWKDVAIDLDALSGFISKNKVTVDLTQDQMRQRVIHRLIYATVAEKILQEKNIVIDDAKINAALAEVLKQVGTQEKLAAEIEKQYGWTFDEYKQRVIHSMVVLQELQKSIDADPVVGGDREKRAEELLAQIKAGKDFAEVARSSSEDSTAQDGGELGFISRGMTVPAFETALFALKKGELSGIVKSEFGYHIIQAEDMKVVKTKGKPDDVQIKARHILVKSTSVKDVVETRVAGTSVWQLIHTLVPARNRLDN